MDNQIEKNQKEFSEEGGNMEIVPGEETGSAGKSPVSTDNDGLDVDVGRGGKIVIGKINVFTDPFRKRHEKHYKGSRFHLAADIVFVVVILALAAAVIWIRASKPAKNIFLESSLASEEIVSGQSGIFEVSYGNKDGEEAEDSNLTVTLPKNFMLESVEPDNIFDASAKTFRIGDLSNGANGKIKIKGIPFGAVGEREVMAFVFNFKKGGKPMNVLNSLIYTIGSSALETGLAMPDSVYKGVETDGRISLKNSGKTDLLDVELAAADKTWEIKQGGSVVPDNIFKVGKIKAGGSVSIDFTAVPTGDEGDSRFTVTSFILAGKEKLKQQEISKDVAVNVPRFKVSLSAADKAAGADDEISFRLDYQNNEKSGIKDLKLALSSGNRNFAISSMDITGTQDFKKEGSVLSAADLGWAKAGGADIKVKFDRRKIGINDEASLTAAVSYEMDGIRISYPVHSRKIKIFSSLNVKSAAYYYSPQGDQLGVGPLPPTVDIPTRYWIFWEADNLGNDLKDLSFTAQLPENVVMTGNKSLLAGSLQYGQITRRLIWVVDDVSKDGGNYKAGFEVEVIPAKSNIGKAMDLLSGIKYSAYDRFCDGELGGNLPSLTTNLEKDRLANGKGVVAP